MKAFILNLILLVFLSCGQTPSQNNEILTENEDTTNHFKDSIRRIGKQLFESKCASCHAPLIKIVGGPLQNIRADCGEDWVFAFTRNSDSLRETGDIRSKFLYYRSQKLIMPKFDHLTREEIKLILDYCDSYPYAQEGDVVIMKPETDQYSHRRISSDSMEVFIKSMERK